MPMPTIRERTLWNKINYFKRHVSHYSFNIEELNHICLAIETQFSRKVKGAFLNYYEDGNEYATPINTIVIVILRNHAYTKIQRKYNQAKYRLYFEKR